jgi:hypothetical protein
MMVLLKIEPTTSGKARLKELTLWRHHKAQRRARPGPTVGFSTGAMRVTEQATEVTSQPSMVALYGL